MSTEIVVATIGAFMTILGLVGSYYFTKANQLKFAERRIKEEYYTKFIKAVSDSVVFNHTEKTRENLADIQNKLLLVASAEVVNNLISFSNYLQEAKENFTVVKHDELLTVLIKSMRYDLFGNKEVNEKYPTIRLQAKSKQRRN